MHAIPMGALHATIAVRRRLLRIKCFAHGPEMAVTGLVVRLSMNRVRIEGKKQGGKKGQHAAYPGRLSKYAFRQIHCH